jgi:hypothetical protein
MLQHGKQSTLNLSKPMNLLRREAMPHAPNMEPCFEFNSKYAPARSKL